VNSAMHQMGVVHAYRQDSVVRPGAVNLVVHLEGGSGGSHHLSSEFAHVVSMVQFSVDALVDVDICVGWRVG